jgi:hypothetical protein
VVAPVRYLISWAVESQQAARRNALLASTELTALRRERDEIDRVVEAAVRRHAVRSRLTAAPALAPAADVI